MFVKTNDMVKASLFLALGLILPYIFHLTGMAGRVFLPMHIPVLLCGFILGSRYGLIIGFITPFLNSVLTGMPPIYPTGVSMALELATYGFVAGFLYKKKENNIFISLILSMILGRFVSGATNYLLLTVGGKSFVLNMFLTSAFVTSIAGIGIQLVLIPIVVKALENTKGMKTLNG
ncbi:MAG: ECF transporter S component [Clostridium sp.]|uniref:ECF transporter S component n=1 Tax=Clostridium sp. TaxID=1506 RepID=UPI003D6DA792